MSQDPPASGAFPHAPAAPSLVGEVLDGRYRITRKIGEGGMGEVWAADHVHIEKKFAIKLLKQEIVSNAEAVTRFRQEARSASSIGHRNIIAIEDFGQLPDGRIYMCMELLNGTPLNDLLKTPLTADRLLNIMIQTGHGLAAAHSKGIIHRDMKPENVFVTVGPNGEDVPKLLDFGIAKVAGGEGQNHLTRTGTIFGTPFYMAPEQALGNPVDGRTDVYAMGVILYEIFSGSVPFGGESFMGILTQHITTEPEPIAQRAAKAGRHLPPGIAEIVGYAMQKDPAHRYQSMDDFVNALVAAYRALAGAGMSSYMEAFPVNTANAPSQPSFVPTHMTGTPYTAGRSHVVTPTGGMPSAPPAFSQPPAYSQPPPYASQPSAASQTGTGYSDPGSSMLVPAKKSKTGLFAVLFLLFAGGGGAAWYFLAGPGKSSSSAGTGSGSGSGSTEPIAVVAVDAPDRVIPTVADAAIEPTMIDATVEAASPPDAVPVVVPSVDHVLVKIEGNGKFEIFDEDTLVAEGPENVEVTVGTPRRLTLKAKGFKDQTVEVSSEKSTWAFKLERVKSTTADIKPKLDCRNQVLDPLNAACRKQFCKGHPDNGQFCAE
jgi:serine/threonine protein kinase